MQKLTFIFSAILMASLLFSTLPTQSMETGYEQSALIAQNYNENECPLFCVLPPEQLIAMLPYCLLQNQDRIKFYLAMQMFVQLKTVCKTFDQLLTIKEIGYCCKGYTQAYKDQNLQSTLDYMPYLNSYRYNIIRTHALILIYAGANANIKSKSHTFLGKAISHNDEQAIEILFQHKACPNTTKCTDYDDTKYEPLFLRIKTPKIAQMFIDKGAGIHTNGHDALNVLWRTLNCTYSFEMMEFYLKKEVNARQLNPSNNYCLLHEISSINTYLDDRNMFFEKVELLLKTIPDMLNVLNTAGETPLDRAQNRLIEIKADFIIKTKVIKQAKNYALKIDDELPGLFEYQSEIEEAGKKITDKQIETTEKLIALLKKKGAKTAQELAQQEVLPK